MDNETLDKNEPNETPETNKTKEWSIDNFNGEMPQSGGIKSILGKTIRIINRKKFKVDYNPESKFDKPDDDGKVTKYIITTYEKYTVLVKGKDTSVSNFFVTAVHYDQLKNLVPDGKSETLDKMFEDGKITPEIVPCKRKGGSYGKYYTWLTPQAYKKADESGDLFKD